MATQNISEIYPVELVFSGTADVNMELRPMNDKANAKLASWFTAHGAKTTVAITQTDANRGGAGVSDGPYDCLKLAFS
jgi:hypothetical protein